MSEDMGFFIALLLNGVSIGLMYSLIALGFVLVYKSTDAINFAQGEFVMMAALIGAVVVAFDVSPILGAIAAVVIGGASLYGGRGSMIGTLVGVFIMVMIRNGLNLLGVSPFWQAYWPLMVL